MSEKDRETPSGQDSDSSEQQDAIESPKTSGLLETFVAVIRKRWPWILLGSVLSGVVIGVATWLLPNHFSTSYLYSYTQPTRSQFGLLKAHLLSDINLRRTITALRAEGLDKYASGLETAWQSSWNEFEKFLSISPSPPFPRPVKTKQRSATDLKSLKSLQSEFVTLTISRCPSVEGLSKIAPIIRHNVESLLDYHSISTDLKSKQLELKEKISTLEVQTFELELSLKRNKAILAGLQKITTEGSTSKERPYVIQIDVKSGADVLILPVEYQKEIVASRIVNSKEALAENETRRHHLTKLFGLWEKCRSEIEQKGDVFACMLSQYRNFLKELALQTKDPRLGHELASHIAFTDTLSDVNRPITDHPKIVGTHRKPVPAAVVGFLAGLLISILCVFLFESVNSGKVRPS